MFSDACSIIAKLRGENALLQGDITQLRKRLEAEAEKERRFCERVELEMRPGDEACDTVGTQRLSAHVPPS